MIEVQMPESRDPSTLKSYVLRDDLDRRGATGVVRAIVSKKENKEKEKVIKEEKRTTSNSPPAQRKELIKRKKEFCIMKDLDVKDHFKVECYIDDAGTFWLKQRKMPGDNLTKVLESQKFKGLNKIEKLTLSICILRAIQKQIHRYGYVHADIKPDNIMVDLSDPANPIVNIIDVDLSIKNNTPGGCGSPEYIAPELFGKKDSDILNKKVDVFSAGIVIAQILSTKIDLFVGIFKDEEAIKNLVSENRDKKNEIKEYENSLGAKLRVSTKDTDLDQILRKKFNEKGPLCSHFLGMLATGSLRRFTLLESLNNLEKIRYQIQHNTNQMTVLESAQALRKQIEEDLYSAKTRNLISQHLAQLTTNREELNKEELAIFTDTLNMDGVKECETQGELIERVKSSCYLETILFELNTIDSELNINHDKSNKTYIRALRKELIALQKSIDGKADFTQFSRHVESRIFAFYSHSMLNEGIFISRFRKGLEELMNNKELLFRQRYGIHFSRPGETRDFDLGERLNYLSSSLQIKEITENTEITPNRNPKNKKLPVRVGMDENIYQLSINALYRTNLSNSGFGNGIRLLHKQLADIQIKYPFQNRYNKECYDYCITFSFQLDRVKTERNKSIIKLKKIIDDLMRNPQSLSIDNLKAQLVAEYSAIRKNESEKFLSIFRKSSHLGDFLEGFLTHELQVDRKDVPHKYDAKEFTRLQTKLGNALSDDDYDVIRSDDDYDVIKNESQRFW